jgi:hypothetical protein
VYRILRWVDWLAWIAIDQPKAKERKRVEIEEARMQFVVSDVDPVSEASSHLREYVDKVSALFEARVLIITIYGHITLDSTPLGERLLRVSSDSRTRHR